MIRKMLPFLSVLVLSLALAVPAFAGGRNDPAAPEVYVVSQDLVYDSIIAADPVPMEGPFQKLEMGPHGLQTQYGPGDQEYVGGRWWLDVNGDGEMNEGDHFFVCPLLGPGRPLDS